MKYVNTERKMETLILKSNNKDIRQTLRNNNIKVCRCAAFPNSLWLTYDNSVTNLVHGVGYCDETCPATPEQVLKRFIKECESPHFCNNIQEFINEIKQQQNGNCK